MFGLIAAACVILTVLFLTLRYQKMQTDGKRLPPGPPPMPVLGNLWTLKFTIHEATMRKLAKVYGNVFTIWVQQTPVVVLNGFRTIRDGLTTHPEDVSGRPSGTSISDLGVEKGIVFSNGQEWKEHRRFVLTALRSLGMGKKSLEQRIQAETRHLVERMRDKRGQPFDPLTCLGHSVMNIICAVTFGHHFATDDEKFHQLFEAICTLFHGNAVLTFYGMFPWIMRYLPGGHQRKTACYKELLSHIVEEIRLHEERGAWEDQNDVIDFYLAQLGEDHASSIKKENLPYVITDLFLAGTETTLNSLHWTLLYMVAHPEIQDKVRKELEDVLPPSQEIFYDDREKLPYTNAVIHEVQRLSCVAGFMFRKCIKDTTLNGFSLPKDTMLLINLESCLRDPKEWETPQQFNPNHFLDEHGNFTYKDTFLPFSTGHRVCVGEKMARTELFIIFATLIRAFKFKLPVGVKQINTQPVPNNLISMPHPYQMCAVPC